MNLAYIDTNFQRLLLKCEEIAEKQELDDWRFEKYVLSLDEMLKKMNSMSTKKISNDTAKEYAKKVEFLKQLTLLKSKSNANSNDRNLEPLQLTNPGPILSKKDMKSKQIYHKVQLNQENQLRQQLLGKSKDSKNNESETENVDMNKLLMQQQVSQEKLALEMLKSVENIKNNSLAAKQILVKDNKTLSMLNSEAEKNSDNLSQVSNNLSDRVSRSCNCWIWLMVMLIMTIFIMMVLFMKLFPKKQYSPADTDYSAADEDIVKLGQETYKHFINNKTIVINNQTIHKLDL